MKALSPKTLQRKYAEAKINKKEKDMLHMYFTCFSNLYGFIPCEFLWPIFKTYERGISKEKFFDFVNITQREDNKTYAIYNEEEIFDLAEPREYYKLLINKRLIGYGRGKFWGVRTLNANLNERVDYYCPLKNELFKFKNDQFYETPTGKKMVNFINNIRCSGIETDRFFNDYKTPLINLDADTTLENKKFNEIRCYSRFEQFQIDYEGRAQYKEKLKEEYGCLLSVKVLKKIEDWLMFIHSETENEANRIIGCVTNEYGGILDFNGIKRLVKLIIELNNNSNLWLNRGWAPSQLFSRRQPTKGPIHLQFGENIQKMIDSGEYDLEEMKKAFKEMGIDFVLDDRYRS